MKLLCFGDSIAEGVGQALKAQYIARVGASYTSIASWPVPAGYDAIIISMGTNPGGKTPAQIAAIRPALATVAAKCGKARLVWILPHFIAEAAVVDKFARERGEPSVSFRCVTGFHPASYQELARDIKAALA